MSQVIFNSYIDLKNYGTTPSAGYTVAYDLDGVLKQKDQFGVITPISASSDLENTLSLGNYSGTYSIVMGTASRISTINGNGRIQLDYGNTSSVALSVTQSTLVVTPLQTATYSYGAGSYPLPNLGSIIATVSVAENVIPTKLYARINLLHDYLGDVVINLKSPSGKVVNLLAQSLGNKKNLTNTIFVSDLSLPAITTGTQPYTSSFRWNAALNVGSQNISYRSSVTSLFLLMNSNSVLTQGDWVFYIEDNNLANPGTFSNAELWFEYRPGEVSGTITQNRNEGLFVTSYGAERLNTLSVTSRTFSNYVGTTTYSTYIENTGSRFTMGHIDQQIGSVRKINVIDSGKTYDFGSINKAWLHLNTFGSTTSMGVRNSVIVGGTGLTASKSQTVYLGNFVNINNQYTLPNVDGQVNQVLQTNGGGTVSWATFSITGIPLSTVLSIGSYSGTSSILMGPTTSIVLGTNSTITNINNLNSIQLDYQNDIYMVSGTSSLRMGSASFTINGHQTDIITFTGSITTTNGLGLRYSQDYSTNFENESLVTKRYVDANSFYETRYVAYVDPYHGSDPRGTINRPSLPYSTIAAAMLGITSSGYDATSRGMIYLRKGNYTEIARLEPNVDYFCEPRVIFTENGFKDFSLTDSSVYGHASFLGNNPSLVPLLIQYSSTVDFNFDVIDNLQSIARIYAPLANVTITGNRITTKGGAGYGLSVENGSNVGMYVKEYVKGAYNTIRFQNGYTGTSVVRTPYLYVDGALSPSGISGTLTHALYVGSESTGNITVNANIEELSSAFVGNNQAAVIVYGGYVSIDGKIKGNKSYGLYVYEDPSVAFTNQYRLRVNGDVTSDREAIYVNHDYLDLNLTNSFIRSEGLGTFTQSIYMGSSASMYINNSTIYNGLTNSSLMKAEAEVSTIGIYNSIAYSPGTDGVFIVCTFSDYTIGYHNLRSNKDNADNITDLFDPSGFIYDPYLFVPNF